MAIFSAQSFCLNRQPAVKMIADTGLFFTPLKPFQSHWLVFKSEDLVKIEIHVYFFHMKLPLHDLISVGTYHMKVVYLTYSKPSSACLYHIESYIVLTQQPCYGSKGVWNVWLFLRSVQLWTISLPSLSNCLWLVLHIFTTRGYCTFT